MRGLRNSRVRRASKQLLFGFISVLILAAGVPAFAVNQSYTVTFAENDGVSDPVSVFEISTAARDLTLFSNLSPSFSDPGHTFSGWNTEPGGGGISYGDSASYSFSSDIELYAQWNLIPLTHTVTFAENDGSSDSVSTFEIGSAAKDLTSFSNLSPSFSDPGHTFSGWNTEPGGVGISYGDGASYSFSSDVELYAQWTALPNYTVTFS